MKGRVFAIVGTAVLGWTAWAGLSVPRRAAELEPSRFSMRPVVSGAYHVHSLESDGTGSIAEIAAAAARAGLQFVIMTDHGNGTRATRPPRYYNGVLCLEEVEVSTSEGHYAVLGLPQSPYPLGGEARDVAEDVARMGGLGIAAHPDSAKRDLQWRAWDAPFPALEWFNGDSQWRDEERWRLPPTLLRYLSRPAETVASLFDRPDALLTRWDDLSQRRHVIGLAGHDAHQRLGLRGGVEPDEERYFLKLPSYEQVFRAFAIRVELDNPLREHAATDAPALLDAIRAGRVYTAIDAVASPPSFAFEARVGESFARMGDHVPLAGPIALSARSNAPPGSSVALFRNGRLIDTRSGSALNWFGDQAGVYRVEIHVSGSPGQPPIPWIVSNPIWVGVPEAAVEAPVPPTAVMIWPQVPWAVEKDRSSTVVLRKAADGEAPSIDLEFALGGGTEGSPYVAVVTEHISPVRDAGRVAFRVTSDRPMRASLQVREQSIDPDDRWRRSFYADTTPRDVVVTLADLRSVRPDRGPTFYPERAAALMFVVDSVNTRPGARGRLVIDRLRTER